MDQTGPSWRHGDCEAAAVGDLYSLLAMLDRPEDAAPLDDGLNQLAVSIARLRRQAQHQP